MIVIYDINGKVIDNIASFKDNFVLIACSENCNIQVLNPTTNNSRLITNDNNILEELTYYSGNIVTVYIDGVCDLVIGNLPYRFTFKDTNIIPEHYNTLIQNKNLPSHDEIFNCIVDRDKYMILGKLLLDYHEILKHKGKKLAVTKFLNFIGFERIQLFEEYRNGDVLSLIKTPDSTKTGNYHLIYEHDYHVDGGYTTKNLPELIRDDNSEDFIEIFFNAISVAKKYFMVPEQDISFFGITFQTNVGKFISNTSNALAIHGTNPSAYIDKPETFNINLLIANPINNEYIIKDCLSTGISIENRSVTFEPVDNIDLFKDIFYVKDVLQPLPDGIEDMQVKFGCILDLSIVAPDKYFEYSIVHMEIPTINIGNGIYREHIANSYNKRIYLHIGGVYELIVDTYNEHNNRERFKYQFTVSPFSDKVAIQYFNSTLLLDDVGIVNSDVESTMHVDGSVVPSGPIHDAETIATVMLDDITQYFTTLNHLRFTDIAERYVEKRCDSKYKMDDFTTMPMDFIDNFLSLTAYEVLNSANESDIIDYLEDIGFDEKHLYVFMDIEDEVNKYMLVLNKETGYENDEIVDYVNLLKFSAVDIPVNYDFDVPDFLHEYKSLYPRLTVNNNVLKINDIFYARVDLATVIGFKNVTWRVYHHITGELLHTYKGYSLKYRVVNKYLFDVELEFTINGVVNTVYKNKCFSGFGVTML